MTERKVFRVGLVVSCAIHFALLVFFPSFRAPLEKIPQYIEVALVFPSPTAVIPEPARGKPPAPAPVKAVVAKKVVPAKEVAPEKKLPKVSAVEINVRPSQKVPVLNPRVESESEMKVSFPVPKVEPVVGAVREPYRPEKEETAARFSPEPVGGARLPPKAVASVGGDFSYQRGAGGTGGGGSGGGGEGSSGFKFEGVGGRSYWGPGPEYPLEAQDQGITGSGRLKICVLTTGEVLEVMLLEGSGWGMLDRAAIGALRQYHFSKIAEEDGVKEHEVEFFFGFSQ